VCARSWILPCRLAEAITGAEFGKLYGPSPDPLDLAESEAFNRYRGTGWHERAVQEDWRVREIDFGGCADRTFALSGDPAIPIGRTLSRA